jgi:TatA/E family protein of Tat protein translocase
MLTPTHLVLFAFLILLALVVFGPKRLPEFGHGLGRAIQEFKHASAATVDEVKTIATSVTSTPEHPTVTGTEVNSNGTGDHVTSVGGSEAAN